jgi:hypothetical protein
LRWAHEWPTTLHGQAGFPQWRIGASSFMPKVEKIRAFVAHVCALNEQAYLQEW